MIKVLDSHIKELEKEVKYLTEKRDELAYLNTMNDKLDLSATQLMMVYTSFIKAGFNDTQALKLVVYFSTSELV